MLLTVARMDPRGVSPGEDEEDKKIAHSNVHTLPVPMQLDIARGGEGEGSGSAAVEKEDEETESAGEGLSKRIP